MSWKETINKKAQVCQEERKYKNHVVTMGRKPGSSTKGDRKLSVESRNLIGEEMIM